MTEPVETEALTKEQQLTVQGEEAIQQDASQNEAMLQKAEQGNAAKEKTAEELALEQGYYACCFRSH